MKKLLMFLCSGLIASSSFAINPDQVCLYEHANYQGESRCFSINENGGVVSQMGSFNDKTSSIEMGSQVMAHVFEHNDYGGQFMVLSSNVSFLPTMNDKGSSLKILNGDTRSVCLFKDANLTGGSKCFNLGGLLSAYYNLADYPGWNDQVSSMHFNATASGYTGSLYIEAYENSNFQGKKWIYDQETVNFVNEANDRISSIILKLK